MASTYSARFRLNYQAPGDNINTWGTLLNTAVFQLLEDAIAARVPFALSGAKVLTSVNGAADEARCAFLDVTGGTGGAITIPGAEKIYLVRNGSTGDVTVTTGAGTIATVYSGEILFVACDASNVRRQLITNMGGLRLQNVADPTAAQDAATRAYVDATAFAMAAGSMPGQGGNAGRVLGTNGAAMSWVDPGGGAFALTADITPAQITANQNNYAPTDAVSGLAMTAASVLRLSTDASRNITGLAGGADGRLAIVMNVGAQPAVLKNQDAASTAANRFAFGVDRTLEAGRSIILVYDATQTRWVDMGPLSKALAATLLAGTDDERYLTTKAAFDAQAFFALTDGATINWSHANGFNFTITLGGNRTLAFPTSPKIQGGVIEITQDGTGSRTLSFAAGQKRDGGAPTLSTAIGAKDYVVYQMITTGLMIFSFIKAPS